MFKNQEIKRLALIQIIVLVIFVLISYLFSLFVFNIYKSELIKNNSYILTGILKEDPDLEEKVVEAILNHNEDNKLGLNVLKKYGLDNVESLDYLNYNQNIKKRVITFNLLFTLIIFIILELLYFLFIKKQYKKINEIDTYMNNVLNDDYSMDIREYMEGDISNLKNDIYKMTTKLKEQTEISKKDKLYLEETLSDISHQIKTPLTSMYVINDILMDDNLDKNDKKDFILKNRNQLERIEWLVTSLLKMSRLDSGTVVLKRDTYTLDKIIEAALTPLKIPLELKNINFKYECDKKIKVQVDFNWTVEALLNIIKNACEHTKERGNISIVCKENPIFVEVRISDDGEGIDKSDLPHIFERFYKGKHNKESIGIGLNMAKKIIDMQNGDINVLSALNRGTIFIIKFYKKNI